MSANVLVTGLLISLARICDVSLGTLRTMAIVREKGKVAFVFGFFEVLIWITVVSTVVRNIAHSPVLAFFYALGFASGNAVGIALERRLDIGPVVLRVFSRQKGEAIAKHLRQWGQAVTTFAGTGLKGPVTELCIACRRRDLRWIIPSVKEDDPEAFYFIEPATDVSRLAHPRLRQNGGWRGVLKKK